MTENMFQQVLEELAQQVSKLQRFSREDPGRVKGLLGDSLAGLRLSLEELQAVVARLPEGEHTDSNGSGGIIGESPESLMDARPGRALRFRTMAERSSVLVRIMRTDTRCRWANRAWLELTGRSMNELLGRGWLRDVHPEDRDRCERICREASHSSRLYRLEYRLQCKSGEYGWVVEIGTPRLSSRGRVVAYLGTAIEVTEHKLAETRLALQYEIARIFAKANSLEEAATPILQSLCERLGWDVGELWTVDTEERVPHCTRVWAPPSIDLSGLQGGSPTRAFPPGTDPPWQSGTPVWIADTALDQGLAHEPEAKQVGLHGMFRLPISVHGEIRAILRLSSRRIRERDDAAAEFMASVGVQMGQFLERKRSEVKVRESEARKAAILEASLDAVITIDREGRVVEFNSAAANIFGYRRENVLGRPLLDMIVPPRLRAQAWRGLARYRDTVTNGLLGKRFGTFAMKSDGSVFPVEVAVAPIGNGDQPMLTIYVCDATARKQAEREIGLHQLRLRALMADLLLTEEHERRRLAADLHDGLSQTIALTQIKLSVLRRSLRGGLKGALDEIEGLIAQTDRAARSISFELSPPVLHDLGLEPAVQWLVENIRTRYGIEIELENDGLPKPADEKTRVIFFRSIRELLINAAKHAGARRVHVRLERQEDRLNAAVEDDGVGMEAETAAVKGSGLFSIHERLGYVGGSMSIESAPGRGTKVRLCAPLTNGRTKAKVKA